MERRSERRKKIVKWIFLTPLCIAGFLLLGNFIILHTKLFDTIALHIAEKYMLENYPEFKDYDQTSYGGMIHTIRRYPFYISFSYKMDYFAAFSNSDTPYRFLRVSLPGYFPFQVESAFIRDDTEEARKAIEEYEKKQMEENRKKYWGFTEEPAS